MTNEDWINIFINKFNESKDYKITDISDREKLLDELRPTGEWIYLFTFCGSKVYGCTHCKGRLSLDIPQRIEDFKFCNCCGAKMKNTESEETKMENMTVTEYRERLIEAFQNTGNDNLIALVCLPDEDSFKALENLLRNFWNKKGGEEE